MRANRFPGPQSSDYTTWCNGPRDALDHGCVFFCAAGYGAEIVVSHPRFYWGEVGNALTRPLFTIPIPASRGTVPTGYSYVMPDQNGWQVFDAMCHVAPRVPVLIITAVPHQAKRAAQLGAAASMEKPLHLPRLLQILSDVLAESVETRRARTTGKAAEFDTLPAWPKAQPSCTGGTC